MKPLPDNWRTLASGINAEVNALPYVADESGKDVWDDIGLAGGDCDNFAIGKLNRLYAIGFPIERLRLATCFIGADGGRVQGEGHVVLVVDAQDDRYVLDNRHSDVVPVASLIAEGITLDRIQAAGGSRTWIPWKHE